MNQAEAIKRLKRINGTAQSVAKVAKGIRTWENCIEVDLAAQNIEVLARYIQEQVEALQSAENSDIVS